MRFFIVLNFLMLYMGCLTNVTICRKGIHNVDVGASNFKSLCTTSNKDLLLELFKRLKKYLCGEINAKYYSTLTLFLEFFLISKPFPRNVLVMMSHYICSARKAFL